MKNNEKSDEIIQKIGTDFDNALDNDFNTHLALSAFFQLVKECNRLAAEEKLGKRECSKYKIRIKTNAKDFRIIHSRNY